jgi:hypothetical protein
LWPLVAAVNHPAGAAITIGAGLALAWAWLRRVRRAQVAQVVP